MGKYPKRNSYPCEKKTVHIHCVSVGEFNGAKVLIKKLLTTHTIILSTTTKTGFAAMKQFCTTYPEVQYCYFPFDIPFAIRRFLRYAQPDISVVFETEIWPHYAKICHQKGIKIGIINARLSAKSFKKYYKYQNFSAKVLGYFDFIATQNQQSTDYFTQLGAKNIYTLPSLKFEMDINLNPSIIENIKNITQNKKFIICASTHANEEEQIIKAYLKHKPCHLLVIMPRHPERFNEVEALLQKYAINYQKQSTFTGGNFEVLLADSMGQLMEFYSLASLAFIGGSLVPRGGHNILEALAVGTLGICGPHIFNFTSIINALKQYNALLEISNAKELFTIADRYYQHPEMYQELIWRARTFIQQYQGASDALLKIITSYGSATTTPIVPNATNESHATQSYTHQDGQ